MVRVRVVRSMYLPAALHGIEASWLASVSLRKLLSSIHRVVWTRRQPWASVGAVFSLLDGQLGVTMLFVSFGSGLGCFVGIFLFGLLRLVGLSLLVDDLPWLPWACSSPSFFCQCC